MIPLHPVGEHRILVVGAVLLRQRVEQRRRAATRRESRDQAGEGTCRVPVIMRRDEPPRSDVEFDAADPDEAFAAHRQPGIGLDPFERVHVVRAHFAAPFSEIAATVLEFDAGAQPVLGIGEEQCGPDAEQRVRVRKPGMGLAAQRFVAHAHRSGQGKRMVRCRLGSAGFGLLRMRGRRAGPRQRQTREQ